MTDKILMIYFMSSFISQHNDILLNVVWYHNIVQLNHAWNIILRIWTMKSNCFSDSRMPFWNSVFAYAKWLYRKICNSTSIIQFEDHVRTIHTNYCEYVESSRRNIVDIPNSKWPSMSTKFKALSLTSVQVQLKVDVNTSQVYDSSWKPINGFKTA